MPSDRDGAPIDIAEIKRRDVVKASQQCHTDLSIFHAVINMMEQCVCTQVGQQASIRIIKLCRDAAQRQLRDMDRLTARASE